MKKIKIKRIFNFYIDNFFVSTLSIIVSLCLKKLDFLTIYIVAWFVYYITSEFLFYRTIGKAITGTIIIFKKDEGRLKTVVLRTLSRLIPFEPFTLFLDEKGLMLHDRLSNTEVKEIAL